MGKSFSFQILIKIVRKLVTGLKFEFFKRKGRLIKILKRAIPKHTKELVFSEYLFHVIRNIDDRYFVQAVKHMG